MSRYNLLTNESLTKGNSLISPDGRKKLVFQDDSHVCLYIDNVFAWGTGTNGTDASRLTMQSDGNLVVYNAANTCLWQSATSGRDGQEMELAVQDDANLVIYANNTYIWATETVRAHRFKKVEFRNFGRTAFDSYPLVRDAKTGETVWNGRDNRGQYWCVRPGQTKEVDFGGDLDQDGNRLDGRVTRSTRRAMKLGLEIVGGDNVWFNKDTFIYDHNCTDVWQVTKLGGLREGLRAGDMRSYELSIYGVIYIGDIPFSYDKTLDCLISLKKD